MLASNEHKLLLLHLIPCHSLLLFHLLLMCTNLQIHLLLLSECIVFLPFDFLQKFYLYIHFHHCYHKLTLMLNIPNVHILFDLLWQLLLNLFLSHLMLMYTNLRNHNLFLLVCKVFPMHFH